MFERKTKQSQAILHVLRTASGPLTPEQILREARQDVPSLGLATVYRTLDKLSKNGLAAGVTIPGSKPHYEASPAPAHDHFVCGHCRTVYKIERPPNPPNPPNDPPPAGKTEPKEGGLPYETKYEKGGSPPNPPNPPNDPPPAGKTESKEGGLPYETKQRTSLSNLPEGFRVECSETFYFGTCASCVEKGAKRLTVPASKKQKTRISDE